MDADALSVDRAIAVAAEIQAIENTMAEVEFLYDDSTQYKASALWAALKKRRKRRIAELRRLSERA